MRMCAFRKKFATAHSNTKRNLLWHISPFKVKIDTLDSNTIPTVTMDSEGWWKGSFMNIAIFPTVAGFGQPQIEAGLAFSKPSLSVSVRSDLHQCTPMDPPWAYNRRDYGTITSLVLTGHALRPVATRNAAFPTQTRNARGLREFPQVLMV